MNNTMEYKGYIGTVEFSEEDSIFFGKVQGIRSLISYEGENAKELVEDFHNAVDEYLQLCAQTDSEPEKAFKGSFNVRLKGDLHKRIAVYALNHQQTINNFIKEAVTEKLQLLHL